MCLLRSALSLFLVVLANWQIPKLGLAAESKPGTLPSFAVRQSMTTQHYQLSLIDLNPAINRWHILEIQEIGRTELIRFHLENRSLEQKLSLVPTGIRAELDGPPKSEITCLLWENDKVNILHLPLAKYPNPFFPLCNDLLYIRLQRPSNTDLSLTEWATDLLRKTSFGEDMINAVKPLLVSLEAEDGKSSLGQTTVGIDEVPGFPRHATMAPQEGNRSVTTDNILAMAVKAKGTTLDYGQWYETKLQAGVFAGLFIPALVHPQILSTDPDRVLSLATEEQNALVYLAAYDLSRYTIEYAIGTAQPPINTSPALYGSEAPLREALVSIGSIPPYDLPRGVAVFIGGFKEQHGKIVQGIHRGKTYGYIQGGVELEPMSPGLASIYIKRDGETVIGAWPNAPEQIDVLRRQVVSARQNGVLLIDDGRPGELVSNYKSGNWSADAGGLRRSLRSGICLQEQGKERFLIFMAFTSATPSAMARVMQAYHCSNAMHLDMNAYMYLHNAVFRVDDKHKIQVEYLNKEMIYPPRLKRHRFIMDNNSRDFFYVKARDSAVLPAAPKAAGTPLAVPAAKAAIPEEGTAPGSPQTPFGRAGLPPLPKAGGPAEPAATVPSSSPATAPPQASPAGADQLPVRQTPAAPRTAPAHPSMKEIPLPRSGTQRPPTPTPPLDPRRAKVNLSKPA